jgi:ATP-dependent Clp protease, protease subunit
MPNGHAPVPAQQPPQPPAPPPIVYINFSAEITPQATETLLATVANLVNQRVPHIYLFLSTQGGSVMHGMTIYNMLMGLPCDLTIHNVGNVDSIGNAIFLAGRHRYACQHSTFMFHGVGFNLPGGLRLEEKFLLERLDSIRADHNRIGQILRDRTSLNGQTVKKLFREAQTKDANFALTSGIIHEIREVQVPAGGPVISLVFQR